MFLPRSDKNPPRLNSFGLSISVILCKLRCGGCGQAGACQNRQAVNCQNNAIESGFVFVCSAQSQTSHINLFYIIPQTKPKYKAFFIYIILIFCADDAIRSSRYKKWQPKGCHSVVNCNVMYLIHQAFVRSWNKSDRRRERRLCRNSGSNLYFPRSVAAAVAAAAAAAA